jgi:hypothetical protein
MHFHYKIYHDPFLIPPGGVLDTHTVLVLLLYPLLSVIVCAVNQIEARSFSIIFFSRNFPVHIFIRLCYRSLRQRVSCGAGWLAVS